MSERQTPEEMADAIAAAIRAGNGSLDPAYKAFEVALEDMRSAGLPVESLAPGGGLGFLGRKPKDGQTFWTAYSQVIGEKLCQKNSTLRHACNAGAILGAGSLVTVIMTTLALPATAIGIAVGIAGIVAALGIDAFCRSTVRHGPRRRP